MFAIGDCLLKNAVTARPAGFLYGNSNGLHTLPDFSVKNCWRWERLFTQNDSEKKQVLLADNAFFTRVSCRARAAAIRCAAAATRVAIVARTNSRPPSPHFRWT